MKVGLVSNYFSKHEKYIFFKGYGTERMNIIYIFYIFVSSYRNDQKEGNS